MSTQITNWSAYHLNQFFMKNNYFVSRVVFLLALMLSISWITFAQEKSNSITINSKKVTGTVQDAKGNGIPGVSVAIKGTTTGTTTDVNGNYSITVKSNSSELVFSSVGFVTKSSSVASRSTLNITLDDDVSQLNEVVVTGYSSQRKKDITGAVAVVGAKELTAVPSAS
ncbi:MAG: hypothetical protein RL127_942, partial [Bacteroidota bacterium]